MCSDNFAATVGVLLSCIYVVVMKNSAYYLYILPFVSPPLTFFNNNESSPTSISQSKVGKYS